MNACITRETFVFTVFRRVFHSTLKLELCRHACRRRDPIISTCRYGKNMPTTALVLYTISIETYYLFSLPSQNSMPRLDTLTDIYETIHDVLWDQPDNRPTEAVTWLIWFISLTNGLTGSVHQVTDRRESRPIFLSKASNLNIPRGGFYQHCWKYFSKFTEFSGSKISRIFLFFC